MLMGWFQAFYFYFVNGVAWKLWFGCIPNSDFCVVQPCRFVFTEKQHGCNQKHGVQLFVNDFFSECTEFAIISRNQYQNRHPDPYRNLVGTLNPWNGRPRVVPWPILLERVVSKHLNRRPYLLDKKHFEQQSEFKKLHGPHPHPHIS